MDFATSGRWKNISRMNQAPQREMKIPAAYRIFSGHSLVSMHYLLYDKHPICLMNGILYSMLPIEAPSIGYSLIVSDMDKEIVLLRPKYITENQAIHMLFDL